MLKLREIRLAKGLSVPQLVELSGVSRRTIQDLESRGDCRISTARALCDAMGVTLDEAWPSEKQPAYVPAIFHKEDVGYSVSVPDLEGCYSQGETLEEAIAMIHEAVKLYLNDNAARPTFSPLHTICCENGDFALLIPYEH